MKMFKSAIVCLSLITMISCMCACSKTQIDNIEKINATYNSTTESQIYPSNLNAFDLEQTYSRWDIFLNSDISISGISFLPKKMGNENASLYMTVQIVTGEKVDTILSDHLIVFGKQDTIKFSGSHQVKMQVGEEKARQIVRLSFKSGVSINEEIKFKLDELKLTIA